MNLCSSSTINFLHQIHPKIHQMTHSQGIVSILRSDNHEKPTKAASLRRTLSADMSSRKWLAENGVSASPMMKKIASSEQIAIDSCFSLSSSSDDEEECEVNGKGEENPRRLDIWTAIMSQKVQEDSSKLPPPYVHPLVKKSGSLSEKSLKVCTESLGSETGSDVFSETGEENKDEEVNETAAVLTAVVDVEEHKVVKLACLTTKKTQQARSFPPPLPSLAAARTDGPSLHMHSRRSDGRLVLEAVTVPQQKYFEAQRHDGRFLLTLINNPKEENSQFESDAFDIFNEENIVQNAFDVEQDNVLDIDIENKEIGILKERPQISNNMHKATVTMKGIKERDNRINPSWSRKKLEVVEEEHKVSATPPPAAAITQFLPPRAAGLPPLPPPAANSVNSYQYFWRAKPTVASVIDPLITQQRPPTKTKDLVLLRGNKADCLLPSLKGCKGPRRSLVMWEPFCIATS